MKDIEEIRLYWMYELELPLIEQLKKTKIKTKDVNQIIAFLRSIDHRLMMIDSHLEKKRNKPCCSA